MKTHIKEIKQALKDKYVPIHTGSFQKANKKWCLRVEMKKTPTDYKVLFWKDLTTKELEHTFNCLIKSELIKKGLVTRHLNSPSR